MNANLLIPIINKHSIESSEIRKIGNQILKNKLIVKYNYIPRNIDANDSRLIYSSKTFNWQLDYGNQTNMAMLHLHSLEPISYLLLAYNDTNEIEYLKKSYELLFDWYEHSEKSNHFHLWYRHCVADRAVIISQLYFLKDYIEISEEKLDKLYQMIFSHRKFLTEKENYIMHNHGLLMDIGLVSLSIVTNDEVTLEFSYKRIRENFSETFTKNMICVENSISYSVYNINEFIKCQKYLIEPSGKTIDNNFDCKIEKALNFLNEIKQPNNQFPHLGDGEQIDLRYLKTLDMYKYYNSHSLFKNDSVTEYRQVYPDEGYAVFKNKNFYLFITAGDIKKNHKHADDLSFVLFHNKEVFIDSGIYSYDNNDLRAYQTSASAHNTIVLNNETYDYINNNGEIKIVSYNELKDYYYIILQNSSYNYADIIRHIFIMKSDFTIIIIDEVSSNTKVLASQFFNLSPALSQDLSLISGDNTLSINDEIFIKKNNDSFLEFFNGMNPYKINATFSKKFHDLQPIMKLSNNKYSKNPTLITMISSSIFNSFDSSNIDNKLIIVDISGEKYSLFKEDCIMNKFQLSGEYMNIERSGKTVKCETIANIYSKQEYAWDIMIGKEREEQIWYQSVNKFEYTFSKPGTYSIRCYIRNIDNIEEKYSFINKQKIVI